MEELGEMESWENWRVETIAETRGRELVFGGGGNREGLVTLESS